jgi:hypothetical protein
MTYFYTPNFSAKTGSSATYTAGHVFPYGMEYP